MLTFHTLWIVNLPSKSIFSMIQFFFKTVLVKSKKYVTNILPTWKYIRENRLQRNYKLVPASLKIKFLQFFHTDIVYLLFESLEKIHFVIPHFDFVTKEMSSWLDKKVYFFQKSTQNEVQNQTVEKIFHGCNIMLHVWNEP